MRSKNDKDKPNYSTLQNVSYLIKNLWRWDKKLFFVALLQVPIIVVMPLLGIYIPKIVIDSVTRKSSINGLFISLWAPVLCMVILNILLSSLRSLSMFKSIAYRMKYSGLITEKTLDTDFENIDGPTGQQRIEKACNSIDSNDSATEAIIKVLIELSSNLIGFIIYSKIISKIHPFIVVFLVLSSIINYLVGRYVNNYEHRNKANITPIQMKLRYVINWAGNFKVAKDMRLYNMFPWFKEMFSRLKKEKLYYRKKNIYHRYFSNFVDGSLIFLRDGITYGFLIYSVLYRHMSIGDFVLYFGAVSGFSNWLTGVIKNYNSLNSISLDVCDLREYLELEDSKNRKQGVKLPDSYEMPFDIELRNLYYKYPGAEDYTIKGINVHIKKGEKIALVGVNGAGKSTLVKLICGLYTPTKGEVLINGTKVELYNRDEYYSLISVVFQDVYLLPMSIEKNIALKSTEEINSKEIDKVIKMSGLSKKINNLEKGKDTLLVKSIYEEAIDLSGGEMQKLMLARALYKNSPIIILDEPTAALDPLAESEIYEKYNELTKGSTSIFISHRLSSTRFCDRILFVGEGNILEEGSHEELMNRDGQYKKMYDMQSYYYKESVGDEKYA
ncbi:ABC transporter ATP-binding protein [Clostridium sp. C8-1-8]|uniref:ABC transporter ATP-binding protein n=1 Tax=Clostridium sp. C8-1-8 TaxID=2698831 RepID=UPI00136BAE00|nr:ABC transporter ATP-binding protein [Clostridium sp. C8-1-8]